MKRVGILGGTFNPVHIGHLTVAQMVHEQLKLDEVIFVPSHLPPHKSKNGVASPKDRFHMLHLAIKDNPKFKISDFEVNNSGKSYSINTVRHFRDSYLPRTKLYFIIGSDLLPSLHTWKNIDQLVRLVTFVAVSRPGFEGVQSKIKVKQISIPGLQTSSSYVRQRLVKGKTVKYLVPDKVLNYIAQKKLYGSL